MRVVNDDEDEGVEVVVGGGAAGVGDLELRRMEVVRELRRVWISMTRTPTRQGA